MLNHEVFDAIINYYNNDFVKKKVVISFEKDNYIVKADVAAPSIVLSRHCSNKLEDMITSALAATYHIIRNSDNSIIVYKHNPLFLNSNLSRYESTTINPSSVLFNIYTSLYA